MFSKKDYELGIDFLPYLINNDSSGLTYNEIKALDQWLLDELKDLGNPTNYHFVYSRDKHFTLCDINQFLDDCVSVTLMYVQ